MIDPNKQLRVVLTLFGLILVLAVVAAIASTAGTGSPLRLTDAPVTIVTRPSTVTVPEGETANVYLAGFLGTEKSQPIDPGQVGSLHWSWSIVAANGGRAEITRTDTDSDQEPDATLKVRYGSTGSHTVTVRCEIRDGADDNRSHARSTTKDITVVVSPPEQS